MTTSPFCPQCGQQVPSLSPGGLCPKCLMAAGLEGDEQPTETHSPGGGGVAAGGFVPPDPALLSKHFPQLEILELLGRGGMGAVYKARQRELDRLVAVKVLPPVLGRDPTFAERFTREARALAKLNHTNIVTIHEVGRAGEFYYFVMEYVDGTNLRDLIQGGACQPRQVLSIIQQMCESLQYAHDLGVVHRDIKPENILIDRQGQVKVADFGLAKLFDQKRPDVSLTGEEQVLGTLRYMAPEQMQGSHDVDHRADIYSLGIVFYELLTGEVPMGRFEPPSKRVQIDVRLDEVVLRTLEREPEKRYQQASHVKTDVVNIVTAPATNGGHVADKCGRLWPWLTWKAFAGYAFVTVFLLLVTIHVTFQRQTSWTNAIGLAICVGFLSLPAYCWERWPYVPTLPWKNRRNWAPVLAPLVMLYAISYQITGGAPAEADGLTQRIVQFGLLFWTMLFMFAHHHPLQGTFRRWRGRLTRKPEGTHQSTGDVKTDVEHPGWTWPDWAIAAWGLLGVIGMASGLILSPWVSRTTTYALLPIGGIMTSLGALFLFIRGLMRRATREKRADSAAKRNPKK